MARKESITKQMIIDAAYNIARTEGMQGITARNVAEQANCSTQPIFRTFQNMEELMDGVYERAALAFQEFYRMYPRTEKLPFCNLGLAYIAFAKEEKELFRILFVGEKKKKSFYEILNGNMENVRTEIQIATAQGCKNPSGLFMKLWIFIHGAACMTMTGDYDLSDEETKELLQNICRSFMSV